MIENCSIRKNVNMTIKDGLKKIKELIAATEIRAQQREKRTATGSGTTWGGGHEVLQVPRV